MSDTAESSQPEPSDKRRWYQYSLRSLVVVMVLLCILFALVGYKIRQAEIWLITCDVSSRTIGYSGFYSGTSTITTSHDETIRQDTLDSLLRQISTDNPTLEIVLSGGQNKDWVFYVAHNGKSRTQVMLLLLADDGVKINGEEKNEPFDLPPGVHGFHVHASKNPPILVDHVFVPLK